MTTVADSAKTDHTTPSPHNQCTWMTDWSTWCMTGSTGYSQKPDLLLISSTIASHDKVKWLSPKVIRENSRKSFQLVSCIGKTMDTKAYLVMVDQPWRHFVLGLSLANDELQIHFYDHFSGSISPPFNIHAKPDSFLYILSGLMFGIHSCIGFDMTIEIVPPLTNSHRAHLIALLSIALETPGSIMLPPAKSGPSITSQLLCVDSPWYLSPFKLQPPSGDQAPLSMLRPAISMPKSLSSSPETMACIGTIWVGQLIYDIVDILFSSMGFLGWGTVCYYTLWWGTLCHQGLLSPEWPK